MKTGKKILSIVLALLMMTTTCTSALVASACSENNHDAYKEAADMLDLIDNKLDAYDVDLVSLIDGAVDGKSLLDKVDGYISTENLNGFIEGYVADYLKNGQWILDLGNDKIMELINKYLKVSTIDGKLDNLVEDYLSLIPSADIIDDLVLTTLAEGLGISSVDDLRDMLPSIEEIDKIINEQIGIYVDDGKYLVELLDKLIADLIKNKVGLEYTDGVLSGINGELVNEEMLNSVINDAAGDYINSGKWVFDYVDDFVKNLVDKYADIDYLNELIQTLVLADNSSVMQTVCNALSGLLPVDTSNGATYDAVIKAIIPVLSSISMDLVSSAMSGGLDLTKATPSAFYYLAGLDVDENGNKLKYTDAEGNEYTSYLDYVNKNLAAYGVSSGVSPLITLSATDAEELKQYVQLERSGATLADIAAAGFDWTKYVPDSKSADIANALIKIAIGDKNKLGAIVDGLSNGESEIDPGADIAYILVDLINDLKTDPVRTIIKKLGSAQFNELANFLLGIVAGLFSEDATYATHELYASGQLYDTETGEFYDFLTATDADGNKVTVCPKDAAGNFNTEGLIIKYNYGGLDNYLGVVDSLLPLLNGLYDDLEANDEDILKTLLVDRIDYFEDLLYKAVDMLVDMGLSSKNKLEDQIYFDKITIRMNELSIKNFNKNIEDLKVVLEHYQGLRGQLAKDSAEAKLNKAIELELLDPSATEYDEAAVQANIDAKVLECQKQIDELNEAKASIQTEYDALSDEIAELEETMSVMDAKQWEILDALYEGAYTADDLTDPNFISDFNTYFAYHEDEETGDIVPTSYNEWYMSDFVQDCIVNEDYASIADNLVDFYLDPTLNSVQQAIDEKTPELEEIAASLEEYNTQIEELDNEISYLTNDVLGVIQAASDACKVFLEIGTNGQPLDPYDDTAYATLEGLDAVITDQINAIETINVNDIAPLESKNAELQEDIKKCEEDIKNVDVDGYEAERTDFKNIVKNLIALIKGNGADDNLYNYYVENGIVGALLSKDRVGYLEGLLDSAISLFDYFSDVSVDGIPLVEHKSELHEIVAILFDQVVDGLYEDFISDPVGALASRVDGIEAIVNKVYEIGFFRTMIDEYRPLIDDVTAILNDEFAKSWASNKSGTLLESLGKIEKLIDDALKIDAVAKLAAPYMDLIELVKYIISEDFYNELTTKPLEFILSDDTLGLLFGDKGDNGLVSTLLGMFIKDEEQLKSYNKIVADLYNDVLYYLYHDFLANPVIAVADRIDGIVKILDEVTALLPDDAKKVVEGIRPLVTDIQNIFDDNFGKEWMNSKVTAVANRLPAVVDLATDALNNDTVVSLLNNALGNNKGLLTELKKIWPDIAKSLKEVAVDLVKDYNSDPLAALVDRVSPLLDVVSTVYGADNLINEFLALAGTPEKPEDQVYIDIIKNAAKSVPGLVDALKQVVSMKTVESFFDSPVYTAVNLIAPLLDGISAVTDNSELVESVLKTFASNETLAETVNLVRLVCRDFSTWAKELKGIINTELLDSYAEDQIGTLFSVVPKLLDFVDTVVSDKELVNEALALVQDVLGDYADLIHAVLDNFSSIKDVLKQGFTAFTSQWNESKTKAIIATVPYIRKLIKTLVAIPEVADLIQPFKNTIEVLMKLTDGITVKGDKIIIKFIGNKPLDAVLNQTFVSQLMSAAKEITPLIFDGRYSDLAQAVLGLLDGLYFNLKNCDLIYTLQELAQALDVVIKEADKIDEVKNLTISGVTIGDFFPALKTLVKILDKPFHDDFYTSPVDAILSRLDEITKLLKQLTSIDAIKNLEIKGIKIADFLPLVKTAIETLDSSFYKEFQQSALMAILHRATYIQKIAKQLLKTGVLDKIVILDMFKLTDLIKIVLPLLSDNDIYEDFSASVIGTFISSKRLSTVCSVLKNAINYVDIFASGVNSGLCQAIDGLYGLLNGLYEELNLGGASNQAHNTSRVIVNRLPAIQNFFHSLSGLVGEGKLINVTNAVSDAPVVFKTTILDAVAGVDMLSTYYYGISDILDALNKYLGEGDWNTLTGIINSLNKLGPKLIPNLEEALSVSDVEWSDLSVPTCHYSGTAEDYVVELCGSLGEDVITPLVDTLAAAALTIPAIKDLVGEIQVTDLAGLLNDVLGFDLENNELKFDAFNTEHLVITIANLVLPKEAKEGSADTADEVILTTVLAGVGAVAVFTVAMTVRRRKED